ncbi:unnamed protein product [Rhizoctonia solani]|uniref:CRIB domain-containing protein n=1 Tax=Rhizoctonia solani AG-3 Rhs1AP TaxID=1086054 RepID=X8JM47_9AGAM|nr:hypothetical protein RSOL_493670 [Rhizoctonia solani AG-3 Rhs1AP]CAE6436274.1 unnamed protein product [Rhizoctonia solani]
MLSLLCGSPDVVDSPFYDTHSRRASRGTITRLGRSGSSKTKKRILKGSIGAPTGFRHEGHMGSDNMMAPTGSWDLDQWRTELEKHMHAQSTEPTPASASAPTTTGVSRTNSMTSPRRKPVPSLLPPPRDVSATSSATSSPIRARPIAEHENEDSQAGVAL